MSRNPADLRCWSEQVPRIWGERFRAVDELPNLSVLHHGDAMCNLIPQNLYNIDNIQFSTIGTKKGLDPAVSCGVLQHLTTSFKLTDL